MTTYSGDNWYVLSDEEMQRIGLTAEQANTLNGIIRERLQRISVKLGELKQAREEVERLIKLSWQAVASNCLCQAPEHWQ